MSLDFDWDKHNIHKVEQQHSLTVSEVESVFTDERALYFPDFAHSLAEERHIVVGQTTSHKILQIVFTYRIKKIRVITAFPTYGRYKKAYKNKD